MALRASWGISSGHRNVPGGNNGIVTDYSESVDPVAAPLQNEVGADIGHTVYDKHKSIQITVTCKAPANLPDVGATINVGGETGYVTSASVAESNQGYVKFNITVEKFTANAEIEVATA